MQREKRFFQIRISHLLWVTLVVAAFLCGRDFPSDTKTTSKTQKAPVAASTGAPVQFDFAFPTVDLKSDAEAFSFHVSVSR